MAEIDEIINEPSDAQKRINQLSEKVRLTAEERDEKDRLLAEQGTKIAAIEKERDFLKGFSDVLATQPAAKDHKDEIQEKVVKGGYSLEDATFAVLGKAGKLGSQEPITPSSNSAPTSLPASGGQKTIAEMTQAERRAALEQVLEIT